MSLRKDDLHRLVDKLPEQNITRAKRYLEMLVRNIQPESAAVSRPHNKPFYIDSTCPICGTILILVDFLDDPNAPLETVWHDEFICPACRDYIYLDWPETQKATLSERQEKGINWDEFKRELDL
jgi:hypothetical protein